MIKQKRIAVIKFSKLQESGFGLVEVMIAVSLLGALAFALMTIGANMNSEVSRASIKNEIKSLQSQIESALGRSATCLYNLRDLNNVSFGATPNYSLTSLMQESDALPTYNLSVVPGLSTAVSTGSKLQVISMTITNHDSLNAPVAVAPNLYTVDLQVKVAALSENEMSFKPLVIQTLRIETDASGVIQTCDLVPEMNPQVLCEDLGLVWDATAQDCMGTGLEICATLGGTVDGSGKCITNAQTVNCGPGNFVTSYINGVATCGSLSRNGVWSDWTACSDGRQTRSCLAGTCSGPNSQACP